MPKPNTVIDIEDLPAPARTALAYAVTRKERPPALGKQASDLYILWILAGLGLLAYVFVSGYGEPYTAGQDAFEIVLYALGFAMIFGGILSGRSKKALRNVMRFPPGVYVIGSRLVDARTRKLGVYNLLDQRPTIIHHHVNGSYRNTTINWHGHTFVKTRQAAASAALDVIRGDLETLAKAAEENDVDKLLVFDPVAVGVALAEHDKQAAMKRLDKPTDRPKPSQTPLMVAGLATLALAPGSWFLRNHFSIETAFDKCDSTYEVDAWVEHGGDAARGKLKKAEIVLRDAARTGHADEMRKALADYKDAPAKLKKPTEDALAKRYDDARATALEASGTNQQLTWFVNQVYDNLKKGGSAQMQISVARTDNTQLENLDSIVASDKKLKKRIVPVARYFGTADEQSRIDALKSAIQDGMGTFFPSDVMTYDATTPDSPAIEIFYVIRPQFDEDGSPSFYTELDENHNPVPNAPEYPAIEFELGATLKVTGGPEPQKVVFTASPAPTISVYGSDTPKIPNLDSDEPTGGTLDNTSVYSAMAESAFSDLRGKLVTALGGKAPAEDADGDGTPDDTTGGGAGGSTTPMLDSEPACVDMKAAMGDYMGCDKIPETDRDAMFDAVKGMMDGTSSSMADICTEAAKMFRASAKAAGCK